MLNNDKNVKLARANLNRRKWANMGFGQYTIKVHVSDKAYLGAFADYLRWQRLKEGVDNGDEATIDFCQMCNRIQLPERIECETLDEKMEDIVYDNDRLGMRQELKAIMKAVVEINRLDGAVASDTINDRVTAKDMATLVALNNYTAVQFRLLTVRVDQCLTTA